MFPSGNVTASMVPGELVNVLVPFFNRTVLKSYEKVKAGAIRGRKRGLHRTSGSVILEIWKYSKGF